jgi:hypothetical protein
MGTGTASRPFTAPEPCYFLLLFFSNRNTNHGCP